MSVWPDVDPWVPTWPECAISRLPAYPRAPIDPAHWTWRVPESDVQAWRDAEEERPPSISVIHAGIVAEQRRHAIQARHAAGLDALAAGALKVEPAKKTRNRSPSDAALMALGYAMARHEDGHSQEKSAELATDSIPGVSTRRVLDLLKDVLSGRR